MTDRQRRDRPRARPRGRTPGARRAPRLPCLPVPARQRRTAGLRRRPACCDAGRLCARGQALECRMDALRVARTGVCARVMSVQLLAVGSHGGTAHGNAVSCASLPVSRCEAVGEMARGLRHAGELLAATICASLRAARGPRVCGASGARPRSRFTGGRSFGRPAASQQDPADVCKPGSSVANSTVCVRVRVPAQMQRCVGLPGVGRPAGDAFRRRACPRALLRTEPDQNRYFKVYPTGLWRSPQILKVEFWKARIWLSVWLSVW